MRVPSTAALRRERLESRIATAVERHRLTLVIAPAGAGKTTLLARFAAVSDLPMAWYRADPWDDDPERMLHHLEVALRDILPDLPGGWVDVETAARALEHWSGGAAVLVIDDLHALEGTSAEAVLRRLVDYAPPWLRILAASRVRPDLNLPRLQVSGDLVEIEGDELRFRAWEVEQLFRDFYRDPVPPNELAVLARRTEGWAAGLQLFHLATRGKSADERRRILGGAGSSTRLLREYLARNVLAELPGELRDFLLDTCVLGRLTGDLCDELLERRGSAPLLEELARRQLFTVAVDESDGSYRYHEVLRSHLDRMLVEEHGEAEARRRHQRAARLLEEHGAVAEALVAYCRAEDWNAVESLIGDRGEQVAGGRGLRLDLLPPAIVRESPWLALASARRARADGRWTAALEAYARAEAGFGSTDAGSVSRRERLGLQAWLDPAAIPPSDWTGVLRSGLARDPIAASRDPRLDPRHRPLVRGLLLLAAGQVDEAVRHLDAASQSAELDEALGLAANIAAGAAAALAGGGAAERRIADAIEIAERTGLPWLAAMGRLVARLAAGGTGGEDERGPVGLDAARRTAAEDPWGALLAALVAAWVGEARRENAETAAGLARRLGAGVLEALARGLHAYGLADDGAPEARDAAFAVESLARATGTAGPRLLAYATLARVSTTRAAEYAGLRRTAQSEIGLRLPNAIGVESGRGASTELASTDSGGRGASSVPVRFAPRARDRRGADDPAAGRPAAGVRIHAFGEFRVEVDGRPVSLERVKPRARALLRFLAMRPGVPMHREVIQEALWPDVDAPAAGRSLHVAVSSLRSALAAAGGPTGGSDTATAIEREGDAYRLAVDPSSVDVGRFEQAMANGRAARARREDAGGIDEFLVALDAYGGDLLPQDGPAEWVVERRDQLRREAVEAATFVAEAALAAGQLDEAVSACRRGLELDRFHDPLWRVLIAAREQAGDPGAATRDRREYTALLEGLGIGVDDRRSGA